jgi:hypothetical protein
MGQISGIRSKKQPLEKWNPENTDWKDNHGWLVMKTKNNP